VILSAEVCGYRVLSVVDGGTALREVIPLGKPPFDTKRIVSAAEGSRTLSV
jgi:hypothetical protein